MCPKCDSCDYWKLEDTCMEAKVTYVFDNYFTIGFAFLMSIWSERYFMIHVYIIFVLNIIKYIFLF